MNRAAVRIYGRGLDLKPRSWMFHVFHRWACLMLLSLAGPLVGASWGSCVPGKGPDACSANSTRCFDERSVQVCNPDSCVWDIILPCNNTEMCDTGRCVLNPAFAPLLKGQPPAPTRARGEESLPVSEPAVKTPVKPVRDRKPASDPPRKCGPGEVLRNGECVKTECKAGAKDSRPCNPNSCPEGGMQTRICRENGQWGKWSDCTGCSGSQCTDEFNLSICTSQCVWSSPKGCGDNETCYDGACVTAGAPFIEKEALGDDNRLSLTPMVRRTGDPIRTYEDLAAALANGEVVLYSGRQELSVVQKSNSAWEHFTTTQAKGTGQGAFLAISEGACKRIGTSITNRFVRLDRPSREFSALKGHTFRITYDYIGECTDCWGGGPCFAVDSTEIIRDGENDARVSDWEWSLYDYRVVMGNKIGPNEIGINPDTGEVIGLPEGRVSYYHGGRP